MAKEHFALQQRLDQLHEALYQDEEMDHITEFTLAAGSKRKFGPESTERFLYVVVGRGLLITGNTRESIALSAEKSIAPGVAVTVQADGQKAATFLLSGSRL